MTISVHCFGRVAEAVGESVIELTLPEASTVADTTFKIAVDQRIADNPEPVRPGAEVAVLPPFAGG